MANHARRQIREAVVTRLKTAVTAFSNRVYPYRVRPHITLPDCIAFTPEDMLAGTVFGASGPVDTREVTIAIAVRAKVTDDLDDTLDGYCSSIEKAMLTDDTFGGLLRGLTPEKTEITVSAETEKEVGLAVLTYKGRYRVARSNPEVLV